MTDFEAALADAIAKINEAEAELEALRKKHLPLPELDGQPEADD